MILIKLYICFGFIFVSNAQSLFRPNLPVGKYRLVVNAIRQCVNNTHLPMQARVYLNKKSSNITEFRGNFTAGVPFDDSLIFDVNAASWSLTGGWKPNSIVYVTNKACSKAKFILGNAWYTFTKAFNVPSGNCPILMGTYTTLTGYDTALFEDNNFPKVYFYGKYKFVLKIKTKDNKLLGCMAYEADMIRDTKNVEIFAPAQGVPFLKDFLSVYHSMGTYTTSTGYDTALLEDNNLPKVFFYGKYKFVGKVKTKDNKLLGCISYIVKTI